jgi:hypothetical protein
MGDSMAQDANAVGCKHVGARSSFTRDHQNQPEIVCTRAKNEGGENRFRAIRSHPVQIESGIRGHLALAQAGETLPVHVGRGRQQLLHGIWHQIDVKRWFLVACRFETLLWLGLWRWFVWRRYRSGLGKVGADHGFG